MTKTATPGTGFRGPIYVLDEDGDVAATFQAGTTDLPTAVDDDSTGTADTTDYTLAAVGDTSASDVSGAINDNFATIGSLLDAILERLQ